MFKKKKQTKRVGQVKRTGKITKSNYKFSDKTHPFIGIISFILALICIIAVIALCIISSLSKGNGGLLIGTFGIVVFVISVVGFILAIAAVRKKDIHYSFPIAGILLNGLLTIFFFVLYVLGACI
jgi:hypothetical protein